MNRRAFVTGLGAVLVAPLGVEAQRSGKVARIGYLSSGTATANAALRTAFLEGLRDHGWSEPKNIAIEYRWEAAGKPSLDVLAAELARLPLDAVVAVNTPAALATKRTGTTLPVVFATVSEPVAIGLVDSLSRPGKNFTGLTTINRELMSKRLEVLRETIPGLSRVGYLANPSYEVHQAQLSEMRAAAHGLGLALHLVEVRAPSEFEAAFARMSAPSSCSRTISSVPTGAGHSVCGPASSARNVCVQLLSAVWGLNVLWRSRGRSLPTRGGICGSHP